MSKLIILVVHNQLLRFQLLGLQLEGCYIVGPMGPTLGRRAKVIVFVDQPDDAQLASAAWLNNYRDWVACALLTRLTPDGVLVGQPEVAKADATDEMERRRTLIVE